MDTNEECEKANKCEELTILDAEPYPKNLERSERALRWERSQVRLWKERGEEKRRKKRKTHTENQELPAGSGLLEQMGRDMLLRLLAFLDLRSLIRCSTVDRKLNAIIRSVELRRLWSDKQSPVVLFSSHTLPSKLLLPGSSSPPEVFPPLTAESMGGAALENALVLAAHRGLVCLGFHRSTSMDARLDLVVGNPLTQEWVALPRSQDFVDFRVCKYRMYVSDMGGEAKRVQFQVAGWATSPSKHTYHVFASASGKWSVTKLYFPPRTPFKWSVFDLQIGRWRTELIWSGNIRTGLERSPGEVHRLPHPCLHGFFEWEYKGSRYFGSVWTVQQERYHEPRDAAGEVAGYGVWKVQRGGEFLEIVAAVWAREVGVTHKAIIHNVYGVYLGDCIASGNLVCFCGESPRTPTMPLVVYDMESGRWSSFDEQHPPSYFHFSGNHYGTAVVYTPSLLVAPQKHSSFHQHRRRHGSDYMSSNARKNRR